MERQIKGKLRNRKSHFCLSSVKLNNPETSLKRQITTMNVLKAYKFVCSSFPSHTMQLYIRYASCADSRTREMILEFRRTHV